MSATPLLCASSDGYPLDELLDEFYTLEELQSLRRTFDELTPRVRALEGVFSRSALRKDPGTWSASGESLQSKLASSTKTPGKKTSHQPCAGEKNRWDKASKESLPCEDVGDTYQEQLGRGLPRAARMRMQETLTKSSELHVKSLTDELMPDLEHPSAVSGSTYTSPIRKRRESSLGDLRVGKDMMQASKTHAAFWRNINLAMRSAFWICVFGLPLFSDRMYSFFFGSSRTTTVHGVDIPWCTADKWGKYYNTAQHLYSMEPAIVRYDASVGEWTGLGAQVWCGALPGVYAMCWPYVVQLIIFTVTPGTGGTIQLAWQGMVGTAWAVANNQSLMWLYPNGPLSKDYMEWVCWIDVVFFIFIVLLSGSPTNTIKFSLLWHVYFMMAFMSPSGPISGKQPTFLPGVNIDSQSTAAFMMSLVGTAISVLTTCLPTPLLDITQVDEIAYGMCTRISCSWHLCIEYLCSNKSTGVGTALVAQLSVAGKEKAEFARRLSLCWFETLDMMKFGRKRAMYGKLSARLLELESITHAVKIIISCEDFSGDHLHLFHDGMKAHMTDFQVSAARVYSLLTQYMEDGNIDALEKCKLEEAVASTRQAEIQLVQETMNTFKDLDNGLVVPNLGHESLFLYCLSIWGNDAVQLADEVKTPSNIKPDDLSRSLRKSAESLRVTSKNIKFALKKTVSIGVAFYIGRTANMTVFVKNSAVMAGTLALLIDRRPGSAIKKAFTSVVGATMGKVIPIFLLSTANIVPCGTALNVAWRSYTVFVYIFFLMYVSLTSRSQSYASIACLAAVFGADLLFAKCNQSHLEGVYDDRYKEIGMVIFAIIIEVTIDLLWPEPTVRNRCLKSVKEVRREMIQAFDAFFRGEDELDHYVDELEAAVASAEQWIAECDPKIQFFPGYKTDFKHRLYGEIVHKFRSIKEDLLLITKALRAEDSSGGHLMALLHYKDGMKEMESSIMSLLGTALATCYEVLKHSSDGPFKGSVIEDLSKYADMKVLDGRDMFVDHLNRDAKDEFKADSNWLHFGPLNDDVEHVTNLTRIRIAVLIHALGNVKRHIAEIADMCLAENIHG